MVAAKLPSLNLHAQWVASDEYSITYDANEGNDAPSLQHKFSDEEIILSSNKPSRTGYAFTGWNTEKDGTGVLYRPGDSYSSNGDLHLFAQWNVAVFFIISYNVNGGFGEPEAQSLPFDGTITLSAEQPSRDKYTFIGWNTKADGSGDAYSPSDAYSGNHNMVFFAQWLEVQEPVYHIIKTQYGFKAPTYYHYPRNEYIDDNNFYRFTIFENQSSKRKEELQIIDGRTDYIKTTIINKLAGNSEPYVILSQSYYNNLDYLTRTETFIEGALFSITENEYYDDPRGYIKLARVDYSDPHRTDDYFTYYSKPVKNMEGFYIDSYSSSSEDWYRHYYNLDRKFFKSEQYSEIDDISVCISTSNYYYLSDYLEVSVGSGSDFTIIGNYEYSTPFSFSIMDEEIIVVPANDPSAKVTLSKSFLTD